MGYIIILNNGVAEQSWDQDNTIATDLLLSCLTPQGSFFLNPDFGLPALPKKIDDQAIALIQQRYSKAVKWLLDTHKAKSISVIAEQDMDDTSRIDVAITAVQANDQIVTFETFVEVV